MPPPSPDPLLAALRGATRERHARIESLLRLDAPMPLARYGAILRGFHEFLARWEAAVHAALPERLQGWFDARRRGSFTAQDLAWLGTPSSPPRAEDARRAVDGLPLAGPRRCWLAVRDRRLGARRTGDHAAPGAGAGPGAGPRRRATSMARASHRRDVARVPPARRRRVGCAPTALARPAAPPARPSTPCWTPSRRSPHERPRLDLAHCATEPIRVPGAIQPHGRLAVLDAADGRLLAYSANWPISAAADRRRTRSRGSRVDCRHGLHGRRRARLARHLRSPGRASTSRRTGSGDRVLLEYEPGRRRGPACTRRSTRVARTCCRALQRADSVERAVPDRGARDEAAHRLRPLPGLPLRRATATAKCWPNALDAGYHSYAGHRFPASRHPAAGARAVPAQPHPPDPGRQLRAGAAAGRGRRRRTRRAST